MKLLTRKDIQDSINAQQQDLANRIVSLDGQVKMKLDEYNFLEEQFEKRKSEIEKEYKVMLDDLESKKGVMLVVIQDLENKKESIITSIENLKVEERERLVASRELDLDGREEDYKKREGLLDENNKEYQLQNALLLQALVDIEGKKSELLKYEDELNKKLTTLQDLTSKFNEQKEAALVEISNHEQLLNDKEIYLDVVLESQKKTESALEEERIRLQNDRIHFQSQQNTLESVYLDLKNKGLI